MVTLDELTIIRAPIERCFDLARSVEVHLAGNVHSGETALAIGGVTSGLVNVGEHVTWRAKHFGWWHELTSEIALMDRPRYFQDVMVQGIFRSMKHDHFFRQSEPDQIEMRDIFSFEAPLPILGRVTEFAVLRRYMRKLLRERNDVIRDIAESSEWRRYLALQDT